MKGVSPFIAIVLLVAITVSILTLFSPWFLDFVRKSTQMISGRSNFEIVCNNGGISISDVCFSSGYLSGFLKNSGKIILGNISFIILYENGSTQKHYLSYSEGIIISQNYCCGNLTMFVDEKFKFNISVNNNYYKIHVLTNCSPIVSDEIEASDILPC